MAAEICHVIYGYEVPDLLMFAAGTFAAAFMTGLAGFALGACRRRGPLHFLRPFCARQKSRH